LFSSDLQLAFHTILFVGLRFYNPSLLLFLLSCLKQRYPSL
jgi:hypothetical protein